MMMMDQEEIERERSKDIIIRVRMSNRVPQTTLSNGESNLYMCDRYISYIQLTGHIYQDNSMRCDTDQEPPSMIDIDSTYLTFKTYVWLCEKSRDFPRSLHLYIYIYIYNIHSARILLSRMAIL
jgi:hypothetical protein